MTDFGTDELSDFTRLKRMREGGYFESEGSVPMPEIVADGDREALQDLLSDRRVPVPGHHPRKYAHTNMFCTNCDQLTRHSQVARYENTGRPVFHCDFCCKCHLCRERPNGAQRLDEAVNNVGDSLATWEEQYAAETLDNPTFCTECGAVLRCSVCENTGPGGYCQGCGQKDCAVEGCGAS